MEDGRCGGRVVLPLGTFFTTGRLRLAGFFNNLGRSWIYERDV